MSDVKKVEEDHRSHFQQVEIGCHTEICHGAPHTDTVCFSMCQDLSTSVLCHLCKGQTCNTCSCVSA
jgi:hypothetical protein